jgi:subtilisin family serine protease
MQRRPGARLLLCIAGLIASLAVPALTQQPGPGRSIIDRVNGREAVAGEVLLRFRDWAQPADLAGLRAQTDASSISPIGRAGALRLRSRSISAAALATLLASRADLVYAEPNYIVRAFPSDPSFPQLWALENIGQAVNGGLPGTPGSDIRVMPAWDVSVGSNAQVVAVIDTGLDYDHPDLAANVWSAPSPFTVDLGNGVVVTCAAGTHGFNAITDTCDPRDDHSHGTHVAGTIGAVGNNGIGVTGVNWTTQLMGVKFLDDTGAGTTADAVKAIRFAIEAKRVLQGGAHVRVLSASWGGTGFSQALLDEINAALTNPCG